MRIQGFSQAINQTKSGMGPSISDLASILDLQPYHSLESQPPRRFRYLGLTPWDRNHGSGSYLSCEIEVNGANKNSKGLSHTLAETLRSSTPIARSKGNFNRSGDPQLAECYPYLQHKAQTTYAQSETFRCHHYSTRLALTESEKRGGGSTSTADLPN